MTNDPTSSTQASSADLTPGATATGIGSGTARSAQPSSTGSRTVSYDNCAQVWAAIGRPLLRGEPGYAAHLDADGDGVACEDPPSSFVDHPTGTEQGEQPSSTGWTDDPTPSQAPTTVPTPSGIDSETLASSGFPAVRGIGFGLALIAAGGSMIAALRARRLYRSRPIHRR